MSLGAQEVKDGHMKEQKDGGAGEGYEDSGDQAVIILAKSKM